MYLRRDLLSHVLLPFGDELGDAVLGIQGELSLCSYPLGGPNWHE